MKQSSTSLQEPTRSIISYEVPPTFTDQATKDKIHRHLNDISDVITEEDIRNIDTSITLKNITTPAST